MLTKKVNDGAIVKVRDEGGNNTVTAMGSKVYEAESTALQTVITLNYIVDTTNTSNFMLFINGDLLREGSGNDYTFTSVSNNNSSEITLTSSLTAGLNIKAVYLGLVRPADETLLDITGPRQNYFINGNFDFWQRGTAFASIGSGLYSADRWKQFKSGAMVYDINQSTDVPTFAESGYNSKHSLEIDVTTADASLAAAEFTLVRQIVEGYNLQDLFGKTVTLSFWVKATKTGVSCVSLQNSNQTISYVAEYTINASNTWEKKVITIPITTAGTWLFKNSNGLFVDFTLASGTTYGSGTAGIWNSGLQLSTANQVNHVDSASNFFRLSQVKLELGPSASRFSRAGKNISDELQMCKRYCQKVIGSSLITDGSLTTCNFAMTLPVEMRAAPSVSVTGPIALTNVTNNTYTQSSANAGIIYSTADAVDISLGNFTGLTANQPMIWNDSTDRVLLEAEL